MNNKKEPSALAPWSRKPLARPQLLLAQSFHSTSLRAYATRFFSVINLQKSNKS